MTRDTTEHIWKMGDIYGDANRDIECHRCGFTRPRRVVLMKEFHIALFNEKSKHPRADSRDVIASAADTLQRRFNLSTEETVAIARSGIKDLPSPEALKTYQS
jgi:hypothetical protein